MSTFGIADSSTPDDEHDLVDIPPDEPQGHYAVKVNVPVPTIEQVTAEIARQIIATQPYGTSREILTAARAKLDETIGEAIKTRALPVIEELMSKPLQPTDAFGNPVGEPTSLQGLIAQRVTAWCTDPVDSSGALCKQSVYGNKPITRMAWMLSQIIGSELRGAIDAEVKRMTAELKGSAAQAIAHQIAEKITGMVLK